MISVRQRPTENAVYYPSKWLSVWFLLLSPTNISLVRFCVVLWGQGGNWCLVFISMVALVLKRGGGSISWLFSPGVVEAILTHNFIWFQKDLDTSQSSLQLSLCWFFFFMCIYFYCVCACAWEKVLSLGKKIFFKQKLKNVLLTRFGDHRSVSNRLKFSQFSFLLENKKI